VYTNFVTQKKKILATYKLRLFDAILFS